MAVYILKFARPIGSAKHQAQFYVGWTRDNNVHKRVQAHKDGRGSYITQAVVRAGIALEHVLTLPGGRAEERAIKRRKNTRRFVIQHLGYDPEILPL